jgi:hypothetical protein
MPEQTILRFMQQCLLTAPELTVAEGLTRSFEDLSSKPMLLICVRDTNIAADQLHKKRLSFSL